MTSLNMQIDSTKYGGFNSYGRGQVATLKPGIDIIYNKDCYSEISNYNNRFIPYFNDKSRFKTVYNENIIDTISKDEYKNSTSKTQMRKELDNYQYTHEPNILEIFKETVRSEESTRDKL